MNFVEAIKLAVKGKCVRRRAWRVNKTRQSKTLTEHVGYDGSLFWATNLPSEGGRGITDFHPTIEDIVSNDWVEI